MPLHDGVLELEHGRCGAVAVAAAFAQVRWVVYNHVKSPFLDALEELFGAILHGHATGKTPLKHPHLHAGRPD